MIKNKHIALFIGIIAVLLFAIWYSASTALAQPSSVAIQTSATATSTISFMTPGTATSTYQLDNSAFSAGKVLNMQSIDSVSMYLIAVASSTSGKLDFQVQYSNNNIDWYTYAQATSSVSVSTGNVYLTTPTTYEWNIGATATSTTVVILPSLPTTHERVVFSDPIGASNVSFYSEYDLKKNPSTP